MKVANPENIASMMQTRVEWTCFKTIMEKLGFNSRWGDLIMQCIPFVSYAVRINEIPQGNIISSRGLRQKDPFSPYLF